MPHLPPPSRRLLLWGVLPLIGLFFFGSLVAAALLFPERYDWRYRVISNLLSPRDNPEWYRLPSIGIALTGVLMVPLAGYFERRLRLVSQRLARGGRWAMSAGILLLILAALVVPQHVRPVLGLSRLHETLARTSAIGFGLAMLAFCACGWRDWRGERRLDGRLLPIWSGLTLLPIAGILASEALLFSARVSPGWGAVVKQAMRNSVFWHLGFWEWAGSAAVFAFLASSTWLLPAEAEETRETAPRG
jgi:hypothetical protein